MKNIKIRSKKHNWEGGNYNLTRKECAILEKYNTGTIYKPVALLRNFMRREGYKYDRS